MKGAAIIAAALNTLSVIALFMKTARDKKAVKRKGGDSAMAKGAWTPPKAVNTIKSPQKEAQEA